MGDDCIWPVCLAADFYLLTLKVHPSFELWIRVAARLLHIRCCASVWELYVSCLAASGRQG